jgi:hypothetical protein
VAFQLVSVSYGQNHDADNLYIILRLAAKTSTSRGPLTSLLLLASALFTALYNIYLPCPTYHIPWNTPPLLVEVLAANRRDSKLA